MSTPPPYEPYPGAPNPQQTPPEQSPIAPSPVPPQWQPTGAQPPYNPLPTPPKKSKKKWLFGCAGLFVVFILLIAMCSALVSGDNESMSGQVSDGSSTTKTDQPTTESTTEEPAMDETTADAETEETTTEGATTEAAPVEAPSFSGSGSDVTTLGDLVGQIYYADISHDGEGNFAVWSVDADGQDTDLLVNEIGDYSGQVPINFADDPAALRVEADGEWSIKFHPIADAPRWDGSDTYSHDGSGVLIVQDAAEGLTPVTITHDGESNFVVWTYADYQDLAVNEIGNYEGTTILPNGTIMISVEADGTWTIAKQ